MNESTSLGYRPWLDGLRGIAISTVFIHHLQHFLYQDGPMFGRLLLPFGLLGVDIFFVLSGFLITTLLLEEHRKTGVISFKNFYIRRALRLLPALLFFLVSMTVFSRLFLPPSEANSILRLSVIALLYCTNWAFAFGAASDWLGHLWSLAVEEQFYLIWPLVLSLLLRSRLSKRSLVFLSSAVAVIVCIHRTLLVSPDVIPMRIYAGSDTRADSLLIGCAVAMLATWRMIPATRTAQFVLRIAGALSVFVITAYLANLFGIPGRSLYTIGFSVFAIAVGVVILRVMLAPGKLYISLLERPTLVWIGKLSYSLYLWHFFAIGITLWIPVPNAARVLLSIPIAFGIAACSFYFVERPFLRLKSRYSGNLTPHAEPNPSPQPAASRTLSDMTFDSNLSSSV